MKCENKNLPQMFISIQLSEMRSLRVKLLLLFYLSKSLGLAALFSN